MIANLYVMQRLPMPCNESLPMGLCRETIQEIFQNELLLPALLQKLAGDSFFAVAGNITGNCTANLAGIWPEFVMLIPALLQKLVGVFFFAAGNFAGNFLRGEFCRNFLTHKSELAGSGPIPKNQI